LHNRYDAAIFMASGARPLEQQCGHEQRSKSTAHSGTPLPCPQNVVWLH
jgi:hypothetical protein